MVTAAQNLADPNWIDKVEASVSSRETIETSQSPISVDSGSQATEGTWGEPDEYWSRYNRAERYLSFIRSAGNGVWIQSPENHAQQVRGSNVKIYEFDQGEIFDRSMSAMVELQLPKFEFEPWIRDEELDLFPLCTASLLDEFEAGDILSPFDVLDGRSERSVHEEIELIGQLGRADAAQLKDRLEELVEISIEEPDIRVLVPGSVRVCRQFLEANPNIRTPSLFLTDAGQLRAQWTYSQTQGLALLFGADGIVKYVLFAPDKRRPSVTADHAGSLSWQSLVPSLQQSSNLDWLFE